MTLLLVTEPDAAESIWSQELAALARRRIGAPAYICGHGGPARALVETLRTALAEGAAQVTIVPLLLGNAHPALADIAGVVRWARTTWPARRFAYSGPLATTDHMVALLARRAQVVLAGASTSTPSAATALLLLGPGSDDPAWNAELYQAARLLWEGHDYGWVECAFAQQTQPSLAEGIERCRRLGAQRAVVLPLALFADSLYERATEQARALPAGADILIGGPLTSLEGALAIALQRYEEAQADALEAHSPAHARRQESLRPGGAGRHSHAQPLWAQLPPRYQGGREISARPMGAAGLKYDRDGKVAWGEIWTDFCDLALAGGPPHRGNLLEPVAPETAAADPERYACVVQELTRGIRLVTGQAVVASAALGWIGLVCESEDMALWMLRAIVVENICVRREGTVLFFPAGPQFRLEHEIKNVITVVAKTYHYWAEHQLASRNLSAVARS